MSNGAGQPVHSGRLPHGLARVTGPGTAFVFALHTFTQTITEGSREYFSNKRSDAIDWASVAEFSGNPWCTDPCPRDRQ